MMDAIKAERERIASRAHSRRRAVRPGGRPPPGRPSRCRPPRSAERGNRESRSGTPAREEAGSQPADCRELESPIRQERTGPAADVAPLLVVGIGGTAVQILGKLVDRLHDRIGDESQWPPVQIVLLDSDARA